jgi:uncharacterized membrane protein YhiD involved in acid resistance
VDFANPYAVIEIPLLELIRNLSIGLVLATIWAYVISKSTRLVVDHNQYLPMFLLLVPSMIVIITIIKSSIALSLGLVGALSIVRFRTPIKEPEELLYIFVAIAVGLGLGANQVMVTVIGFAVIVAVLVPFALSKRQQLTSNSNLIDVILHVPEGKDLELAAVDQLLQKQDITYKIKRLYQSGNRIELLIDTLRIELGSLDKLKSAFAELGVEYEVSLTSNARVIT